MALQWLRTTVLVISLVGLLFNVWAFLDRCATCVSIVRSGEFQGSRKTFVIEQLAEVGLRLLIQSCIVFLGFLTAMYPTPPLPPCCREVMQGRVWLALTYWALYITISVLIAGKSVIDVWLSRRMRRQRRMERRSRG